VNGIGVGSCSSAACRTEGCLESQISTKVLRQDSSRSPVHHEDDAGKTALPVPRRAVDRPQDNRRQSQNCRGTATALEGISVRECQDLSVSE
jgi:hypothetical protein